MSGIYIPNMEMPKACLACPMLTIVFPPTSIVDEAETVKGIAYCFATKKEIDETSNALKRCDWCPLLIVTNHGRLIDADALLEDMSEANPVWAQDMNDYYIGEQPTIIPSTTE